jgi:hypothetical protein
MMIGDHSSGEKLQKSNFLSSCTSSEPSRPAGLLQVKQKFKFKSNLVEYVLLVCDGESVLEQLWGKETFFF